MKYKIGDILRDADGNTGIVCIRWNDGDLCTLENDAAHPNPVITSKGYSRNPGDNPRQNADVFSAPQC